MGSGCLRDRAIDSESGQMKNGLIADATPSCHFSSRAFRWTIAGGALTMVVIGVVLLYLLMQATNNRDMYERN